MHQHGEITDAETKALSRFIRADILPAIPEGGRLFPDGSVTAEPDDGVMHVPPNRNKNFEADRAFFVELANACDLSGGFILR